ncbi:MAG: DUF3880 domain-containing protein [Butyrivibrio sp.]|nr:DUF3880 domain-containing protein [Butyrivibrio sp.]
MRILYFDWDEFNGRDCRDAMARLGYHVDTMKSRYRNEDLSPIKSADLKGMLLRQDEAGKAFYDCVFSFDYFPEVSDICRKYEMPYVSWVFDCPHYPLYSDTINNKVNHIHIFDRALCEELQSAGVKTVHHTPLAVNSERLGRLYLEDDRGKRECGSAANYLHDVTFLGNLYDNEFNFYDKAPISAALGEYLDDVFFSQQQIYGRDIIGDKRVIDDAVMDELRQNLTFEDTGKFRIDYDRVIRDILRKKVTVLERRSILEEFGRRFDTVMYTTPDAKPVPGVTNMGIADYYDQMPLIFRRSKVNINMTFRCISTGVPLRVMDVLGAGGFLITTWQQEIEECFEDGKELVMARTPGELLEKVAYYIDHENERRFIAEKGRKKVFEKYSYDVVLPEILKFI